MVLGKAHAMTTLENTISLIRILPEADLDEIQNFAKKLIQKRHAPNQSYPGLMEYL